MTTSAHDAATQLIAAADEGRLEPLCSRLGVRLLGLFGSAASGGVDAADVDVAVSFAGPSRQLELIDALTELLAFDDIDLLVLDTADPVARARGLTGRGLFEAEPGLWATSQMAALAEERDTAWMRELDRRALAG